MSLCPFLQECYKHRDMKGVIISRDCKSENHKNCPKYWELMNKEVE